MSSSPSLSSAFEWPDRDALRDAVKAWAEGTAEAEPRLLQVGYVDSFNPDGSEIESHLDVVLVVEQTDLPPAERGGAWDMAAIPVPTQALVYTAQEWSQIIDGGGWLARKMEKETVWVYGHQESAGEPA